MLNRQFVREHIAKMSMTDYPLTLQQEIEVENLYFELMKEHKNINKDKDTQISLIDEIMHKMYNKETPESIFRQHGDNSHMSYYDVFLEAGESDKILEALHNNDIPTDVLRGVKKNIPFDSTIGDVRIVQEVERTDDSSPIISAFEIYKGDRLVYEWKRSKDYVYNFDIDTKNVQAFQFTKSGDVRKSTVVKKIKTRKDTYTQSVTRKGITIVQDSKGRFAKKEYFK